MNTEEITIFKLEALIKEEKLDELKEFIPQIKGSKLEKEFQRQYSTANLSNAIEHLIKNKNNKEVFDLSMVLGLDYLGDIDLGRLIKQTILSKKIDYYHSIKEAMTPQKFERIQNSSFLTISSAFDNTPNPAFYDWIEIVKPEEETLINYIRASVIDKRMNMDYLGSYLSKLKTEQKEDLVYECLAWSSVGNTHSERVCHLFNLVLPEIDKPLLLNKLKNTLNLAELKDVRLATNNLETFCEIMSNHRPGNMLVLISLINSYNLSTSLNDELGDKEKKTNYKSPKI